MHVIITGGTGLVGKWLTRQLLSEGNQVTILSRNPDKPGRKVPAGARLVRWDARTPEGWGHLAGEAEAIVNLAGENLAGKSFLPSRWTERRRQQILQSRLNAGEAVVEAIRQVENKPKVVFQASAVGFYGPSGDEKINEEKPPADDFLAQVCVAWEASTRPVEQLGVRQVVGRTAGIVLSADEGALPRLVFPHRMFVGGPFGDGSQYYSWIHPKDEARAIQFLLEQENARGPFNLVAPDSMPNREFNRSIGRVLNRPSWLPLPAFVFRLAFGEVASVVVTGQRVVPDRLLEAGFDYEFPRLEPALEDILN